MSNGAGTSATVSPGQQTVVPVSLGAAGVCMLPARFLFDSASSWVADAPDHRAAYAAAMDRMVRSATARLLVVGHTDDVGGPTGNDALSDRRARAVLAVLTGNVAEWEATYRRERVDGNTTPWGRATFVAMLAATGAATTQQSIDEHRDLGAAGQARRATLFAAYFRHLLAVPTGPVLVRSTSPATLGCGENHVLAAGDHRPSRRAELVFFAGTGTIDCPSYPGWNNACAPIPLPPTGPPATVSFHVSPGGDDAAGDGSAARPWRTFAHAFQQIALLRQTGQHVTLNVMGGSFTERVLVPSGTTVRGLGTPRPILRGTTGEPVVLMAGGRDKHLRNLRVTGGERSGVRIENARDVSVRECDVVDNRAPRGGGVSIVDSQNVDVEDCRITGNQAGDIAQAITFADLEISIGGDMQAFEVRLGHSHGGGVYVQGSTGVRVLRCHIAENRAILFGGGLAVDNPAFADSGIEVAECVIVCNQASHADLAALGAPASSCSGADMGDPVVDRIAEEVPVAGGAAARRATPLLHGVGVESGLGGGVALRNTGPATRLRRNRIGVFATGAAGANRARRGGGVECFTGAYPTLEENEIAFNLASDDGGGMAVDQFDPFLPAGQPAFLGFARRPMVPRQTLQLRGNHVHDNRTLEDGGGIYATGAARLHLSGPTRIVDNRAGENGGGIRISYAARLTGEDATIRGNQSNFIGTEREGGGGLAARNAEIHLTRCDLSDNVANAFAGGGAFCTSTFEGGFNAGGFIANRRGQFDEIMAHDFGFGERHYRFTDARGGGNRATGASGAGGYLYALRDPGVSDGVPLGGDQPLRVTLDGAAMSIGVNTSQYDNPAPAIGRRKRANVTIELSGQRDAAGRPLDHVLIAGPATVPAGIALSTPTPDEKAVAVLHGRAGAGDDRPTTFPYQNVGPVVHDLQPRFGTEFGGTPVSITGEAFLTGVRVTFDTVAATVTSVTPTEIRCTTPPLRAGRPVGGVEVVVTNPDTKEDRLPSGFEYTRLSLASISPAVGAVDQPTAAVVTGTGFEPGVQVFVGSQPCSVDGRTGHRELRVTVPPSPTGAPEVGDLVVVNPGGATVTRVDAWEWRLRPAITDVRPRGAPPAGGTQVRVTGARFSIGTQVLFGGTAGVVVGNTSTTLDVVVPAQGPLTPNTVDLEVIDGGLRDVVPGGFTYAPPPVITPPLDPDTGSSFASTVTAIRGTGFMPGIRVTFGTAPVTTVVSVTPTEVRVDVPPPVSAGTTVDVTVENPDGQADVAAGAFTYF